jgi:hypothetical protein
MPGCAGSTAQAVAVAVASFRYLHVTVGMYSMSSLLFYSTHHHLLLSGSLLSLQYPGTPTTVGRVLPLLYHTWYHCIHSLSGHTRPAQADMRIG